MTIEEFIEVRLGIHMAPWQRTLVAALMNTRGAVTVLRPPEFGRRAKMGRIGIVTMMQPGDRVGWIGTDGVLRIDTVPERDEREVDRLRRLVARIGFMRHAVSELLGESEA